MLSEEIRDIRLLKESDDCWRYVTPSEMRDAAAALAAKHEAEWQAEREALRELYRAAMHDLRLQLIERGQDISIAEWYDKIESALRNARAK